jgi:hypothetical protein
MFGGLPGGSGRGGQVASWLYVLFIAIVAAAVVYGLVQLLLYATDLISTTPPKPVRI